jgi:hypothetical protein
MVTVPLGGGARLLTSTWQVRILRGQLRLDKPAGTKVSVVEAWRTLSVRLSALVLSSGRERGPTTTVLRVRIPPGTQDREVTSSIPSFGKRVTEVSTPGLGASASWG